jgi:hypothetical protein
MQSAAEKYYIKSCRDCAPRVRCCMQGVCNTYIPSLAEYKDPSVEKYGTNNSQGSSQSSPGLMHIILDHSVATECVSELPKPLPPPHFIPLTPQDSCLDPLNYFIGHNTPNQTVAHLINSVLLSHQRPNHSLTCIKVSNSQLPTKVSWPWHCR